VAEPYTAGGIEMQGVPLPTDTDTAAVDIVAPAIDIQKTVYIGHNSGAGCASGLDFISAAAGTPITYCFRITNTGDTYLNTITLSDPALSITRPNTTLLSGTEPLAPGASLVLYYQTNVTVDRLNIASTSGNPTTSGGVDLPGLSDPTDSDGAFVDETPGVTASTSSSTTSSTSTSTTTLPSTTTTSTSTSTSSTTSSSSSSTSTSTSVTSTSSSTSTSTTAPPQNPQIGVAKRVSNGPTSIGGGAYSLTYTILVRNTGNVVLNNVQVTDNLNTTFAGATSFSVIGVNSGVFAVNPGYNGTSNTNLLAAGNTLGVGGSGSISVNLTVTPGANLGPYLNTAFGSGVSPQNVTVTDQSQDGTNVDPDNDGNPGNNSDPTPVQFPPPPTTSTTSSTSSSSSSSSTTTTTSTTTSTSSSTTTLPPICTCDDPGEFALLARRYLKLNNDSQALVSVGVNDPGGYLRLSRGSFMRDNSIAQADKFDLGDGASIWEARANDFRRATGTSIRSGLPVTAPVLPLTSPFCPIPQIDTSCNGPDVRVLLGETVGPLPPGTYGHVRILNGGTLLLEPGNFTFCDVKTGQSALIQVQGPGQSTLNVNRRFQLGDGSLLEPQAIVAPIPILNMDGKKLRLGEGAEAEAFISAPNAKLTMGRDAQIHGSACIDFMKTDKHTGFDCPCAQ
jgi:hypothetical protein